MLWVCSRVDNARIVLMALKYVSPHPGLKKKFFSELPFHLISPLVLGTIVYWLAHLRNTFQHFVVFMAIITLESIAAVAVGMAIRCVPSARELLV